MQTQPCGQRRTKPSINRLMFGTGRYEQVPVLEFAAGPFESCSARELIVFPSGSDSPLSKLQQAHGLTIRWNHCRHATSRHEALFVFR